jgi:phage baseplate assembly protein W
VATIDLNNLIRPKQVNQKTTELSNVVVNNASVYTDLHLDLTLQKNVGLGTSPSTGSDLLLDHDEIAIRNSISNIFTTKKGEKLLDPTFGSSLEQYLFEPINETYGKAIGNEILNAIQNNEPRVEVLNVSVVTDPDHQQYQITVIYRFLQIQKQSFLNILAQLGGQILI